MTHPSCSVHRQRRGVLSLKPRKTSCHESIAHGGLDNTVALCNAKTSLIPPVPLRSRYTRGKILQSERYITRPDLDSAPAHLVSI
ncbi:hypothetical protein SCLCIDRAFT_405188 [Scleroderma citrinum Foug A]|uniref:Uncharacterized protein n=1 Tax=Scleroderma citrinum Foug A TaxID=1036808 RepID=A0A0C3DC35_9AGAM|nr:hypothetical protein SCLCIDRAFT_405188 [Scleroderma citrinum Foug A]